MNKEQIAKDLASVIETLSNMEFKGIDCPKVVQIFSTIGRSIQELQRKDDE